MIFRRRMLALAVPVLVYAMFVGCKSSHSTPSSTPGGPNSTLAGTEAAAFTPDPSKTTFDLVISGGLAAEWKDSDPSAYGSCVLANDGFAALNMSGQMSGKPYGFIFNQNSFAAGTYTYPYATVDPNNEPPFIQIATTTDSSVDWTAGSTGLGSGTAVVTGANGSAVKLTVDLDLTPQAGGQVVHVEGEMDCPAT